MGSIFARQQELIEADDSHGGWWYSQVRIYHGRGLLLLTFFLLDCISHQVGYPGRDLLDGSSMVRWRILSCSEKDKERFSTVSIS